MKKRNVFRLATILCSLISLAIHTHNWAWHWHDNRSIGIALNLLSAIFATQWIHYQKRQDAASGHPTWPDWLRRLLY